MVGIMTGFFIRISAAVLVIFSVSGCVSTEELYAQYDAVDCNFVATEDVAGVINLHEQNTDTHFPWEPAVYFALESSELTSDERARLDRSMQVMKQFPTLIVGLQGFTDRSGSVIYNKNLAEQRVKAVEAYLGSSGIALSRVVLQPLGEVLPPIDSDESADKLINRRVELMLLDVVGKPVPVLYATE